MRKLKNEELGRASIAEFKIQSKFPVAIVLDNVRSMNNIGSLFRTADGFAVDKVFLCGITAQPPHREIEKTALGATQSVHWGYYPAVHDAILELRAQGYRIIAVEQVEGSVLLNDHKPSPSEKYALIFGNEVDGVSAEAVTAADTCIEIPQFGTKHSFNIVVSAGIVLWDFYTKLQGK